MLTDIENVEKEALEEAYRKIAARKIVIERGQSCFCVNENGSIVPAIEYYGKYFNLHGDKLDGNWERLYPRKNLLSFILKSILVVSLIAFVVLYL